MQAARRKEVLGAQERLAAARRAEAAAEWLAAARAACPPACLPLVHADASLEAPLEALPAAKAANPRVRVVLSLPKVRCPTLRHSSPHTLSPHRM